MERELGALTNCGMILQGVTGHYFHGRWSYRVPVGDRVITVFSIACAQRLLGRV